MKSMVSTFLHQHKLSQSEQEQLALMPQSVKLEEAVNPHMVRVTMIVISTAILIFFIWAAFTKIGEVTSATGEVVPRGYTQVVQHLEGALVKEILIRDGDLVDQGQVLIKLEDTAATQNLAEMRKRHEALLLQIERQHAFLEDRPLNVNAAPDLNETDKIFQQRLFQEMLSAIDKEKAVLKDQIAQKKSELKKLDSRLGFTQKSLDLTKEARDIQKGMMDKGYTSKLSYIEYEKEYQTLSAELSETRDAREQAEEALREYETRLASLSFKTREKSFSTLDALQAERNQLQETLVRLQDRVNRLTIRSPVKGIVKGLQLNTIGGVVEPGKALMEIVPLSAKLVIEAQVSPKDVGHIKVGQPIRVKVSSYDFSRYGTVAGTLDYVSATTFLNERAEPFYKVRIGLSKNYVGNNAGQNLILPGMTVVGDIITGEKSILSYLFKPIHLSFKTAFSER